MPAPFGSEIELQRNFRTGGVNEDRIGQAALAGYASAVPHLAPPLAAQFALGAQHGAGWTVCEQRFDEVHDGERMADLSKHEMGRVDIDISYARPGSGKPKHGAFAPEGAVVADERKLVRACESGDMRPIGRRHHDRGRRNGEQPGRG